MTVKLRDISKTDEIEYGALTVGELRELLAYMPAEFTIQAGMPQDGDYTKYVLDGEEYEDMPNPTQHDLVVFAHNPDPNSNESKIMAIYPTKYKLDDDSEGVWSPI